VVIAARPEQLVAAAKELQAPLELVREVAATGKLPVVNFAAGGIATPADAALMMQLGAEAVFVGSGIFKSEDPVQMARAIVEATTHFRDPSIVAKVSTGLGAAMRGVVLRGTGRRLSKLPVQIAGKTGTAQNRKGAQSHSWFIGFAPYDSPATGRIAFSVIVENGGYGGSLAAPIAGEIAKVVTERSIGR